MSEEKGLVTQQGLFPTTSEWGIMNQMVEAVFKSGFLPTHIKNPSQALAIILKGRELQIPPMQALSSLFVVNQRVTAQSDLMLGLALRTGEITYIIEEDTDNQCRIKFIRNRNGQKMEYIASYSMKEAITAQLSKKDVWQKYPKALLRARTIAIGLRVIAADVIMGLYTPEEMGAKVVITEEGEQVVIDNGEIIIEQDLQKSQKIEEAKIVGQEQPILTPGDNGGQSKLKPDSQLIKIHELLDKMKPYGYTDEMYRQDIKAEFKGIESSKYLTGPDKLRLISFLANKLTTLIKDTPITPSQKKLNELTAIVKEMGIGGTVKKYNNAFYGIAESKELLNNPQALDKCLSFILDYYTLFTEGKKKEEIIAELEEMTNEKKEFDKQEKLAEEEAKASGKLK